MAKTDLLAIASPGSRALKNAKYERYCRLRASLQPRVQAYREAGWETSDDDAAYSNACRLERRPGVRERIEYLSHQDQELIAEKRRRIEETLWSPRNRAYTPRGIQSPNLRERCPLWVKNRHQRMAV